MKKLLAQAGVFSRFEPALLLYSSVEGHTKSEKAFFTLVGRDLEDYQISIDDGHGGVTVVRDQSTLTSEAKALVAYLEKFSKPARLK